MALANATHRRVATQRAGIVGTQRHQRHPRAASGGGRSSLATGMAGTDNDHVEIVHDGLHSDSWAMFHVKHGG